MVNSNTYIPNACKFSNEQLIIQAGICLWLPISVVNVMIVVPTQTGNHKQIPPELVIDYCLFQQFASTKSLNSYLKGQIAFNIQFSSI